MLFPGPITFPEALASRRAKALLPTTLTTEVLGKIRPGIRRIAQFSAQTGHAGHVQMIKKAVDRIINLADGGIDEATAKQVIRENLARIGYDPRPGQAGRITDLGSDARLRIIVQTNVAMAHEFGQWAQGQDETVLDMWPGVEFFRVESREEIRNWPERWRAEGGQFFEGGGDYPEGRMICLKNDPILVAINRFGNPYGPFDFNSGMGTRDLPRDEMEEIGLIEPGEMIEPETDILPPEPASEMELDEAIKEALLEDLGEGYEFDSEGVLRAV